MVTTSDPGPRRHDDESSDRRYIARLQKGIEGARDRNIYLQIELRARDELIEGVRLENERLTSRATALSIEVGELNIREHQLSGELGECRAAQTRLVEQVESLGVIEKTLRVELDHAKRQLDSIWSSRSWRVTEPLRRVAHLVRRRLHRGRL